MLHFYYRCTQLLLLSHKWVPGQLTACTTGICRSIHTLNDPGAYRPGCLQICSVGDLLEFRNVLTDHLSCLLHSTVKSVVLYDEGWSGLLVLFDQGNKLFERIVLQAGRGEQVLNELVGCRAADCEEYCTLCIGILDLFATNRVLNTLHMMASLPSPSGIHRCVQPVGE